MYNIFCEKMKGGSRMGVPRGVRSTIENVSSQYNRSSTGSVVPSLGSFMRPVMEEGT